MQHAGLVRRAERVEQAEPELGGPGWWQRSVFGDDLVEWTGLDQLHDDPRRTTVFDDIEDSDHTRMAESRRGPRLAERAFVASLRLRAGRHRREQDLLDRNLAVEQFVPAAPDDPHRTTADLVEQPVASGHDVTDSQGGLHKVQSTGNRW